MNILTIMQIQKKPNIIIVIDRDTDTVTQLTGSMTQTHKQTDTMTQRYQDIGTLSNLNKKRYYAVTMTQTHKDADSGTSEVIDTKTMIKIYRGSDLKIQPVKSDEN